VFFFFKNFTNKFKVFYASIGVLHFDFVTKPCTYLPFVHLLKSSLLAIHSHYFPPIIFVITIMEFSTPNTFVSMEVELDGLCVGVGHLTRCNNNNIVSRLEQEALFENSSNIGINDLIVQEVLLENLKKHVKLWKPHLKVFHTWTFFKVNND
jgi:hypothetical protein